MVLDRDLRAAGIPKRDDRGRTVDVHAMRTTFGTLLSKSGVSPRTAQQAMRHSDIKLTMGVYTDPRLLDVRGAVESLPAIPLAAQGGPGSVTPAVTPTPGNRGQSGSVAGTVGFPNESAAGAGRRETSCPAVVLVQRERRLRPFAGIFRAPDQLRSEERMAVAEDINPHVDRLSGDALDRKAARVDGGKDILDVDPLPIQAADPGKAHICCHVPDRTLPFAAALRRQTSIR